VDWGGLLTGVDRGLGWTVDWGGPWTGVGCGLGWTVDWGGPWTWVDRGLGWTVDWGGLWTGVDRGLGWTVDGGGPWTGVTVWSTIPSGQLNNELPGLLSRPRAKRAQRAERRAVLIFYVLCPGGPTHMHTPATIGGKKRSLFVCNVPLNGEVPITRPIEDMTPSLLQFWNPHTLGTQEMQKKKNPDH
jgi:hypothetical protein